MNEKWAKWAILDIATEGAVEALYEAVGVLDQLYPGTDSANMAMKLVRDLYHEGLVSLFYETIEPTGERSKSGHEIVRSNATPIPSESAEAVLKDNKSWEIGLEVRVTYAATGAGKALHDSAPGPGVSFRRHGYQWRPSDDWLEANL